MTVAAFLETIKRGGSLRGLDADVLFALLERVHRDICGEFPVYVDEWTLSIEANQREYSIDQTILEVRLATYYESATSSWVIYPTNRMTLDREDKRWKDETARTPRVFYIEAGIIGFHPKPDRTTSLSTGYPKIVMDTKTYEPLVYGGNMPTAFSKFDHYRHGMRKLHAEDNDDPAYDIHRARYEDALSDIERQLGLRAAGFEDVASPDVSFTPVR